MSYRSGFGGGYPSKKPVIAGKGYSMNAVPPPSSLNDSRRSRPFANNSASFSGSGSNQSAIGNDNISRQGYSTMTAQFVNTSQYSAKRKSKTEDEYVLFD